MEKNTKSWSGLIFGGLMIIIAGFLIGGYGGSQLTATFLVEQNLNKDTRDVQAQVKALQHLRSGETHLALELLESRLDNDLILFAPKEPYDWVSDQTQASMQNTIKQAKAYRQQYPRKSKRRSTDDMVNNLFDKVQ